MNNDNAPTAEPVAQGEAVARLDDSGRADFERWARCNWSLEVDRDTSGNYNDRETRAAWASWREALRLAAQPRAVPDGWTLRETNDGIVMRHARWGNYAVWSQVDKPFFEFLNDLLAAAPSPGESDTAAKEADR